MIRIKVLPNCGLTVGTLKIS